MARKRSNGEGSIYYAPSKKRWESSIKLPDGRRRTFTGPTRKVVAARLADAQAELELGLAPDPRATVADHINHWLSYTLEQERLAAATERWYRDIATLYVLPGVGSKTLTGPQALTPADVEALTARLADEYSLRTAKAARTVLSKVLRDAEKQGRVGRNVARLASMPKNLGREKKDKVLSVEQLQTILAGVGPMWRGPTLIAARTGLRPGEVLGLKWECVVLDGNPLVRVRRSLSDAKRRPEAGRAAELKDTKREWSRREVRIHASTVEVFEEVRRRQDGLRRLAGSSWSDVPEWDGLVFTNGFGLPLRRDSWRTAMGRVVAGASPHRLRHTYATHLLEGGTPIKDVAEVLGDSVAVVESTYREVLESKASVLDVTPVI